ncbi:hypothetical protein EAO77_11885 [Streptomyces sp. t39]|nr:hypothetical protein EAO77_11885 [Streptomyces sp. t39]
MSSEMPRYLDLNSGRFLRPGWPHAERFTRHLVADAAAITDAELETLLDHGWRPRTTAAWLIGVDRREAFRERLGALLLDSEVCYAGRGYCFALARLGTVADAEILVAYLDRYLPRTDLRYDQGDALGALLRIDAALGSDHAAPFTVPGGPWDTWVGALPRLRGHAEWTPERQRRWTDLCCDFAAGWTSP